MKFLRKYKIYKIFNILNDNDKEVLQFIDFWFDNLIIFTSSYYPDSTFYMTRSGKFVFETTNKDKDVIIRWRDLIQILEIKYSIEYFNLLKYILKNNYNINLESMLCKDMKEFLKIEYAFDKKIQDI